jgi:hypothetical protein
MPHMPHVWQGNAARLQLVPRRGATPWLGVVRASVRVNATRLSGSSTVDVAKRLAGDLRAPPSLGPDPLGHLSGLTPQGCAQALQWPLGESLYSPEPSCCLHPNQPEPEPEPEP